MSTAINRVSDSLLMLFQGEPDLLGVTVEDAATVASVRWLEGIIVGDDGDPTSETEISFDQEWADLAHTRRSETGQIPCAVIVQSGSTDIRTQRTRGIDILDVCERVVRNNADLGGLVFSLQIQAGGVKFLQNEKGSAVIVPFTVSYWTHI